MGSLFVLGFITLFMFRLDLIQRYFFRPQSLPISAIKSSGDKETWMNIVQSNRKIGFSHSKFSADPDGYRLQETVRMRINTMGMVQDINLKTIGRLNRDFSLVDFDFKIKSGRFSFNVTGSVSGDVLTVKTQGAGAGRKSRVDGVSSILITSNDLASAWALDERNLPMFPVVPGGERQREMAYRTGINIVMYALTGNYKADQVHIPALLERLGQ